MGKSLRTACGRSKTVNWFCLSLCRSFQVARQSFILPIIVAFVQWGAALALGHRTELLNFHAICRRPKNKNRVREVNCFSARINLRPGWGREIAREVLLNDKQFYCAGHMQRTHAHSHSHTGTPRDIGIWVRLVANNDENCKRIWLTNTQRGTSTPIPYEL